jgi:hypothetical protein
MATARAILTRAMRLLGALGDGEEPTASEGADGLTALNAMLDSWWLNTLAVYYTKSESFTWAAGQTLRTMGSGGNFDTARPAVITGAFQRMNDVDYPIEIINRDQYDQIQDKTTQSTLITRIYPEMQSSLVYLYAYAVPSVAIEIHIQSAGRLQSFAGLTTAVDLPPGYERALAYNLALELAPEYSVNPPQLVARTAAAALRTIKRPNMVIPSAQSEVGLLSTRRNGYNWHTGD